MVKKVRKYFGGERPRQGFVWGSEQGLLRSALDFRDNGKGVPENDVKAYVWWSMAKANGNEVAKENIDIYKKRMTKEQIAKAQELAAKCYESDYKDCQ